MTNRINSSTVAAILDNDVLNNEIKDLLNALIDAELEKDDNDIDFDFIDDCSDIIVSITNGDDFAADNVVRLFGCNRFADRTKRLTMRGVRTSVKAAIIAAALLVSTLTVNAAVTEYTGKSIIENITAISQPSEEQSTTNAPEPASADVGDGSTLPEHNDTGRDDSIVVEDDAPDADLSDDSDAYVIDDIVNTEDFVMGERVKYVSKGSALDHLTHKYLNGDVPLPQDFDEKSYMVENYPSDICDANDGGKHNFADWKITKKSTCGKLGEKKRTCTLCGEEQICPIKATGKHLFVYDSAYGSPTENKDSLARATCKNCGEETQVMIPYAKTLVLETLEVYYNGSKTTCPKVIAVLDRRGYEIPKKYWKVSFQPDPCCGRSNWISADMDGLYCGAVSARFNLNPAKVCPTSMVVTSNGFAVYWKKSSLFDEDHVTGYEVEYSTHKDFSDSKKHTRKGHSATSISVTGLSSGKQYYVRVRAYYVDSGGRRYNGQWSDTRAVKTK